MPMEQTSPGPHCRPQPPQWLRSVPGSTQTVRAPASPASPPPSGHATCSPGQSVRHTLSTQRSVLAQTVPHAPQLPGSTLDATHIPLQAVCAGPQRGPSVLPSVLPSIPASNPASMVASSPRSLTAESAGPPTTEALSLHPNMRVTPRRNAPQGAAEFVVMVLGLFVTASAPHGRASPPGLSLDAWASPTARRRECLPSAGARHLSRGGARGGLLFRVKARYLNRNVWMPPESAYSSGCAPTPGDGEPSASHPVATAISSSTASR